jgi:hypothetical protein
MVGAALVAARSWTAPGRSHPEGRLSGRAAAPPYRETLPRCGCPTALTPIAPRRRQPRRVRPSCQTGSVTFRYPGVGRAWFRPGSPPPAIRAAHHGAARGRVATALGMPLMPWQQHVADVGGEVDDRRPVRPLATDRHRAPAVGKDLADAGAGGAAGADAAANRRVWAHRADRAGRPGQVPRARRHHHGRLPRCRAGQGPAGRPPARGAGPSSTAPRCARTRPPGTRCTAGSPTTTTSTRPGPSTSCAATICCRPSCPPRPPGPARRPGCGPPAGT